MRKTAYGTPRRQRKVIQISHLQEEIDLGSDDGSVILASRTNGDHFKDWALFPIQVNHQDVHNIFFPKAYPGSIRIEGFLDHKDLTPGPVQLLSTHVSAGEAYLSGADACLFLDGRMQTFRRINLLQGHPGKHPKCFPVVNTDLSDSRIWYFGLLGCSRQQTVRLHRCGITRRWPRVEVLRLHGPY